MIMQGQPGKVINAFNASSLEKAKKYVEKHYGLLPISQSDEEVKDIFSGKNPNITKEYLDGSVWKITSSTPIGEIALIVVIPNTFPDALPKIFLSPQDIKSYHPIPHLDKTGFICTSDPNHAVVSEGECGRAVQRLIEKAIENLVKGKQDKNETDFIDEFLAYWDEKARIGMLSLVKPGEKPFQIKICKLSKHILGHKIVLAESEEEIEQWISTIDAECIIEKKRNAIYLPLPQFNPVKVNKLSDMLRVLDMPEEKDALEAVKSYFSQTSEYHFILGSLKIRGERSLFGMCVWGMNKVQARGFRVGKAPIDFVLRTARGKIIQKARVQRIDMERILKRGGASTNTFYGTAVTIIGCGSLGSYLSMSLARCGLSKIKLIDNELLEVTNVARHLCGFDEVRQKKVDAVKRRITKHFPSIKCETYHSNVLSLIKKDEANLSGSDVIICALGNVGVERRLNYVFKKARVKTPIVYIWMEPFGVAGQILYVNPTRRACYNCCFDDSGFFKYSVVAPSQEFSKRESGCQSTFLPYSALDVEQFISIVGRKIIYFAEKKPSETELYTWIGNVNEFEKMGNTIQDGYVADKPYTTIKTKIIPDDKCELCR